MQQDNSFKRKVESELRSGIDMSAMMEIQKKNMQALAEAQKTVISTWQQLAKKQAAMAQNLMSQTPGSLMLFASSQDRETNAQNIETVYSHTLSAWQNVAEAMKECSITSANLINKRALETMAEISAAINSSKNTD